MSDQRPSLVEQYENAPTKDLKRFWISWTSWLEDWPEEAPFFYWQTGSTSDGRLRPSMKDDPRAANLPEHSNIFANLDLLQITDGQRMKSRRVRTKMRTIPSTSFTFRVVRSAPGSTRSMKKLPGNR